MSCCKLSNDQDCEKITVLETTDILHYWLFILESFLEEDYIKVQNHKTDYIHTKKY